MMKFIPLYDNIFINKYVKNCNIFGGVIMYYHIEDYLDVKKFTNLMEDYYQITGIPHSLVDIEGNVSIEMELTDICTQFCRKNEISKQWCKESKRIIYNHNKYTVVKCKSGLINAIFPVYMNDEHVANLVIGQIFFEEPDIGYFENLANEFGYEVDKYLEAVKKVPVISKEKLELHMNFFSSLADILSNIMNNRYKAKYAEEELKKNNAMLQSIVEDKAKQLESTIISLNEKEAYLSTLMNNIPIEIWAADANFCYTMQNAKSINNYGNVVGRRIKDLHIPEELKSIWMEIDMRVLSGETIQNCYENYFSGEKKVYETIVAPVAAKDNIIGIVGIGLDVTERKNAEEALHKTHFALQNTNLNLKQKNIELQNYIAIKEEMEKKLREEEERYRNLLGVLPYGVYVQANDKILYSNDTAAKILSLSDTSELINRHPSDFILPHPDTKDVFYERLNKINSRQNTSLEEEMIINKITGKLLNIEILTASIMYQNEEATLVMFKDITLKKHLEKKNRELIECLNYEKLRTEFFSNMSHEFRTPLNIIYNAAKMGEKILSDDINLVQNNKLNNYLQMIDQNCCRLTKLINNILDINKFDFGIIQLDESKVNIIDVIESTVSLTADYANNKNLQLIFDTSEEEIITICDVEKIERVMFNLLSNAMKFTPQGGEIFVKVNCSVDTITISVKDTGRGIPEDKLNDIFDRFIQVDKSFSRGQEGSGLGLYIVKTIVEMHGGTIGAKSMIGVGSEFNIDLPIKGQVEDGKDVVPHSGNLGMCYIEFSDIYI